MRFAGAIAGLFALLLPGLHAGDAASRQVAQVRPKSPLVKPPLLKCEPAKFRLLVDVGHTSESQGATSARNDPEFGFNLRLGKLLMTTLRSQGFRETRLLVTEGKARASLFRRVDAANGAHADLVLSIHHDSVPDRMLEEWEFDGSRSWFSDRFSGYSLFVSHQNPQFEGSLAFARLLGKRLKDDGLHYASQYTLPLMGRYRHKLLDSDVGVYRYDRLFVLARTRSPAVLLEAGSIINREEEMAMNSPERQQMIGEAVAAAAKDFCERR